MMIRLYFILLFVAMFTLFEPSSAMRLRRDATTTPDANSTAANSTEMTPVSNTSLSQETSSGSSVQVEPIVSSVASSSKTSEDTNNVDYNAVPNDTDDEQNTDTDDEQNTDTDDEKNTDTDDEGNNDLDNTYVSVQNAEEPTDTDGEGNNDVDNTDVPNDTDNEQNTDTDDENNNDLDNTHGSYPDYEQPIDPEYEGNNEVDNTDVDNESPGEDGSMDGAPYGGDMYNSTSMGWVPMEEEYEQGYDDDSPYQGGFILNTPFFAVDQVERYFMHLERAVEHIFRNVMNEMGNDPNTYRNSSDRVVEIDGHKFNVHTSIINGGDENNSVSVQAVSAVPIDKRRKRSASLT